MLEIFFFKLNFHNTFVNAICFVPKQYNGNQISIFTHGYTSHKGSLLSWGEKIATLHIPSIIFDLPGHFLGGISEVKSFDDFANNAHQLFESALNFAINQNYIHLNANNNTTIFIGGHSLGALLSLKALNLNIFKSLHTCNILVGFGLLPKDQKHLYQNIFFTDMMKTRKQLVSKYLAPEYIFPWIQDEKNIVNGNNLKNKRLHFITGQDDLVVPINNTKEMIRKIQRDTNLKCNITFNMAQKLPHHMPERASFHIKQFIKDELSSSLT